MTEAAIDDLVMGKPVADIFNLTGDIALITGGSRGLGFQIAAALAEKGAKLVLVARKEDELLRAKDRLSSITSDVEALSADLTKPDSAKAVVKTVVERFGAVDILVNAAGTTWGEPAETVSIESWNKVVSLNLTASFVLSQAAATLSMIPRRRGRILNLASIEGLQGHPPDMPPTAAYSASKGGLINLTRALAAEWGCHNITVNALAPGFFPSKMTASTLAMHEASVLARTPLGKLGSESDLKGAALLLCSPAGGHITGQTLAIDGGATVI